MTTLHSGGSRSVSALALSASTGLSILLLFTACGATSGKRAAEGAAVGAAAGALGGVLSAAIFGGDVGDAAARGATWGAATGAVSGAVSGAQEDSARAQQQQAQQERNEAAQQQNDTDRLRARIGDDAYAGLEALVGCKHRLAIAHAQTAAESTTKDHALAGVWLEALAYKDAGRNAEAEQMFTTIVERDPEVDDELKVGRTLRDLSTDLREIRADFALPATCR